MLKSTSSWVEATQRPSCFNTSEAPEINLARVITSKCFFTKPIFQASLRFTWSLVPTTAGFFARAWCQEEFEAHGLNPDLVQCSISFNLKKGTLRGMHFQAPPYAEAKVVRCTMGSDLRCRVGSPSVVTNLIEIGSR